MCSMHSWWGVVEGNEWKEERKNIFICHKASFPQGTILEILNLWNIENLMEKKNAEMWLGGDGG